MHDANEESDDPGHRLTKSVWTDADFATMGWHDCWIYAFAVVADEDQELSGRLLIDLDYIVRWTGGDAAGEPFGFWIAPATLIFHGVCDLDGKIAAGQRYTSGFEISDISRSAMSDPLGYYGWTIDADLAMRFRAAGFREIIRREPQHVADQRLTMEQRGGLSFGEQPYDDPNGAPTVTHALNPPGGAPHR